MEAEIGVRRSQVKEPLRPQELDEARNGLSSGAFREAQLQTSSIWNYKIINLFWFMSPGFTLVCMAALRNWYVWSSSETIYSIHLFFSLLSLSEAPTGETRDRLPSCERGEVNNVPIVLWHRHIEKLPCAFMCISHGDMWSCDGGEAGCDACMRSSVEIANMERVIYASQYLPALHASIHLIIVTSL